MNTKENAGAVDVLAALWHRFSLLESDGFVETAETWRDIYSAVAELISAANRAANAHEFFADNSDLRMTTGDHANRAKLLRAALARAGAAP